MMNKREQAAEAQRIIWYNMASGCHTYALCPRCKANGGRGGGICSQCAKKDLAKVVGPLLAEAFVSSVQVIKTFENLIEVEVNKEDG